MSKNIASYIIVTLFVFSGCATAPQVKIWQPWTRILDSNFKINNDYKFSLDVDGKTEPLLGDEKLLNDGIRNIVKQLLLRRGFQLIQKNEDYKIIVKYKIERKDKLSMSSYQQTLSLNTFTDRAEATAGTGYGLGIYNARLMSRRLSQYISTTGNNITTQTNYIYTIAFEITDQTNSTVWKADSTWDSPNLNFQIEIMPALQIILSGFPKDENIFPIVTEIKKSHIKNICNIYCNYSWFSCPAIPYKIRFQTIQEINSTNLVKIKNPEAFAAYLDLIQTAENALPIGSKNYDNPLNNFLWAKVMIGGTYKLKPKYTETNVLIKLTGDASGYTIEKCWVANDEEFKKFKSELKRWNESLKNYYDVSVPN